MSIYTVREVTGNAKPNADLLARGLNAKQVSMTSLDPLAVAEYPQIAYHLYSKLLPAFMVPRLSLYYHYYSFILLDGDQARRKTPDHAPRLQFD